MDKKYEKNYFKHIFNCLNIFITIVMVIGLILLIVGCSVNNNYLIYASLGGVGIIYLGLALPLRFLDDLIPEEKK